MGLLDNVLGRLRESATSAADRSTARAAPDLDALVTDAEIEAATGAAPVGEPRRNGSDGSETDIGRLVIKESKLENGDKFLISLNNCNDTAAAGLAMDRMGEVEKPLEGMGERGLQRVRKSSKTGSSEVGVTALRGTIT